HRPGSFSINYRTGQWGDFATGDKGGDFVSLVAYIKSIEQSEAAKELARMINLPLSCANGANGASAKSEVVRKGASVDCRSATPPTPRAPDTPTFPARTPPDAKGKPAF